LTVRPTRARPHPINIGIGECASQPLLAPLGTRQPNSAWPAVLALGEHIILSGDIEHLSADFSACEVCGIATNPPRLIAEVLNA